MTEIELNPAVTFLMGENGSGKSTFIEAVAAAYGLNPEGGTKNMAFSTRASHSELHRYLALVKSPWRPRSSFFLRAESFFNVATAIEQLGVAEYYGFNEFHRQSHGESFLNLFKAKFIGQGFYLLDEPEAALSPSRQLSFLCVLDELVRAGAQFIIATHSPLLAAYPSATVLYFDETGARPTEFTDTEHYHVMRAFMTDPKERVRRLLDDSRSAHREGSD